jgi:ubiquinone/menaquinone biosynthesis C-methylase UbiE
LANALRAHVETLKGDVARAPIRDCVAKDIVRAVLQFKPIVVLDAGAGQGHLALAIRQAWPEAQLILVEQSLNMLAAAHRRMIGHQRVQFIQSTFAHLAQIPSASIDFFTSTFALHHVDDASKLTALREARRVLKPDGRLFLADEIVCDPSFLNDGEALLLAMGEVFYPDLSPRELHRKFDGFVEYPTDLTTMAQITAKAGFSATFRVINRVANQGG